MIRKNLSMVTNLLHQILNTRPGDEKWNALADLDKNGTVNIIDITMVARDYGKVI
jgi:hypothetical protein